ncbi:MAG: Tm-1-like ATP-binding domain-containing protein [Acidobacteriota bacterium]
MTSRLGSNLPIVIVGALDTKGAELAFVRDQVAVRGHRTVVVDTGVLGPPAFAADVTNAEVAEAGGVSVATLVGAADRGRAVMVMARGAERIVRRLADDKGIGGIIGIGGGAGTSVATAAMRALPLGIPKVMVSTLASGDVSAFVGVADIVMVPAIVDISGINRISRGVLTRAAAAVCAMADAVVPETTDQPLIAATMFGNTTACVEAARMSLESRGFEVLVFHATGTGGRTMESLIDAGHIAGVLDVTTTEWADELAGGVMTAGSTRLEAAARTGTPAVVAPGCVDMVNFWAPETVPERHRGRRFYQHNANITLMRTTPDENAQLGRIIADKLNASVGPVSVYLPLRGVSVISAPGGPFHWPEADDALFDALRTHLRADIPVHALDMNINDPMFAAAMVEGLLSYFR